MDYKIPNLKFNHKVYGISADIGNHNDEGQLVTKFVFTFYVKRQGILKRWESIYSNFPNIGDAIVKVERYRCIKRDPNKLKVSSSVKEESFNITRYEEIGSSKNYYSQGLLKDKKTGQNVVHETLKVIVIKPFLFVTDLKKEFERVMKIRDFIYAENTRLSAVDKINKLMGNPTLPEYLPDNLSSLKDINSNAPYLGDGLIGDYIWDI